MPFPPNTANRVIVALEMPAVNVVANLGNSTNYFERVRRALAQAELNGGEDLVTRITTLLEDYESQLAAFSTSAQSGESALIKADVLEWSAGAVAAGKRAELSRTKMQLARLLGLDGLLSGGGRVRIVRG